LGAIQDNYNRFASFQKEVMDDKDTPMDEKRAAIGYARKLFNEKGGTGEINAQTGEHNTFSPFYIPKFNLRKTLEGIKEIKPNMIEELMPGIKDGNYVLDYSKKTKGVDYARALDILEKAILTNPDFLANRQGRMTAGLNQIDALSAIEAEASARSYIEVEKDMKRTYDNTWYHQQDLGIKRRELKLKEDAAKAAQQHNAPNIIALPINDDSKKFTMTSPGAMATAGQMMSNPAVSVIGTLKAAYNNSAGKGSSNVMDYNSPVIQKNEVARDQLLVQARKFDKFYPGKPIDSLSEKEKNGRFADLQTNSKHRETYIKGVEDQTNYINSLVNRGQDFQLSISNPDVQIAQGKIMMSNSKFLGAKDINDPYGTVGASLESIADQEAKKASGMKSQEFLLTGRSVNTGFPIGTIVTTDKNGKVTRRSVELTNTNNTLDKYWNAKMKSYNAEPVIYGDPLVGGKTTKMVGKNVLMNKYGDPVMSAILRKDDDDNYHLRVDNTNDIRGQELTFGTDKNIIYDKDNKGNITGFSIMINGQKRPITISGRQDAVKELLPLDETFMQSREDQKTTPLAQFRN
jgi:hypothetical protein